MFRCLTFFSYIRFSYTSQSIQLAAPSRGLDIKRQVAEREGLYQVRHTSSLLQLPQAVVRYLPSRQRLETGAIEYRTSAGGR